MLWRTIGYDRDQMPEFDFPNHEMDNPAVKLVLQQFLRNAHILHIVKKVTEQGNKVEVEVLFFIIIQFHSLQRLWIV